MTDQLSSVAAVVFDMDGVLIDSEPVWEDVRRTVVAEHGGHWQPDTQRRLMGMSTPEWADYLSQELGVNLSPAQVAETVISAMADRFGDRPPFMPGALDAVRRLAPRWPLGLASSSPVRLIDLTLERADLAGLFAARLSTEEVERGKPAPDVYLEVARRLGKDPRDCAAVEDSSNGIRSATGAGLRVVAVPHPRYPPDPEALAAASVVLPDLSGLTPELVQGLREGPSG